VSLAKNEAPKKQCFAVGVHLFALVCQAATPSRSSRLPYSNSDSELRMCRCRETRWHRIGVVPLLSARLRFIVHRSSELLSCGHSPFSRHHRTPVQPSTVINHVPHTDVRTDGLYGLDGSPFASPLFVKQPQHAGQHRMHQMLGLEQRSRVGVPSFQELVQHLGDHRVKRIAE
jgi:hypothetical protein